MKRSIGSSLLLAFAMAVTPRVYATVNECNTLPCRTLWVLVKQYYFQYGNLVSCTTWDGYAGYGYCITATDFGEMSDPYAMRYELAGSGWGLACSAGFSAMPSRVPVYGTNPLGTNEKTVSITLSPSPLPAGKTATVSINTVSGNGGMTFADGTTSKTISQSLNLGVRGTANSTVASNMKINVVYSDVLFPSSLGSGQTTVSTWPIAVEQHVLGPLNFGFVVSVEHKSESGYIWDLDNIITREQVTVVQTPPNPPFTTSHNPSTFFIPTTGGYDGTMIGSDQHQYGPANVIFTAEGIYICNQYYQFKDEVLNLGWYATTQGGILRQVVYPPWAFKTRKYTHGVGSSSWDFDYTAPLQYP